MKKYDLKKIMKRAWEIKHENEKNIFSLCLKISWEENKMKEIKMVGTEKQVKFAKEIKKQLLDSINKDSKERFAEALWLQDYDLSTYSAEDYKEELIKLIEDEVMSEKIIQIRSFTPIELLNFFKEDIYLKKGLQVIGYDKMTGRQKIIRKEFFTNVKSARSFDLVLKRIEKKYNQNIDFKFERKFEKKAVYEIDGKKYEEYFHEFRSL